VVISARFIGLAVSSGLRQRALHVQLVAGETGIFGPLRDREIAGLFESLYADKGIHVLKSLVAGFEGGNGTVEAVALQDGQRLQCDFVVAGIGVRPEAELLAKSGLEVSDGLVVDEYLQAGRPDIYGAGDVANYQDTLFGKRRRVEHWDNAVTQGQYCARALLGDKAPFVHVPYFFSDVFDLSYEFWGDPSTADEIVERGDMTGSSFSVWWLSQERVVAAFTLNRPQDERDAAPRWIQSKQRVSAEKLRGGTIVD